MSSFTQLCFMNRSPLYNRLKYPYCKIGNTEDTYGMLLQPSQHYYDDLDPWDLENYDYIFKNLNMSRNEYTNESNYEETRLGSRSRQPEYFYYKQPRLNAKMSYNTQRYTIQDINLKSNCCTLQANLDHANGDKIDDIYTNYEARTESQNIYASYEGLSSISALSDRRNYIEDNSYSNKLLEMNATLTRSEYAPSSEIVSSHNCCNLHNWPYSISNCYECSYNKMVYYTNKLGQPLYDGDYYNNIDLSTKELLQINYECSWNDLDRMFSLQK